MPARHMPRLNCGIGIQWECSTENDNFSMHLSLVPSKWGINGSCKSTLRINLTTREYYITRLFQSSRDLVITFAINNIKKLLSRNQNGESIGIQPRYDFLSMDLLAMRSFLLAFPFVQHLLGFLHLQISQHQQNKWLFPSIGSGWHATITFFIESILFNQTYSM